MEQHRQQNNMTLGSLFDGSGGFPLGGLISGITPVWASEVEPFAIRVTTKRMPGIMHYGDVSKINGADVPPVDIITFGSPCQDMSVAGKRAGLDGERSSLFHEAVRIIKEMREKTDGRYPRYAVWENVPGAFSSNKGEDFRCVLEEMCKVKDGQVHVPKPPKWENAGRIMGDGYSVAWRLFDAQFWGVPQRRKRIYLVADFDGGSAGKVLFESEGVSGYSAQGFRAWQKSAGSPVEGTAETGGLEPLVFENHSQDTRYRGPLDVAQTVMSTYGTGGNNQPFVLETPKTLKIRCGCEGGGKGPLIQDDLSATLSCNNDQTLFQPMAYGVCSKGSNAMLSDNPDSGFYEAETSRCLDLNGGNPSCNQGGIAVVEGNGSRPSHHGDGFKESEVMYTLNATEQHAVAHPALTTSKASYFTQVSEELAGALVATDYKDPPIVTEEPYYIVRRLTPIECARLQGFPDWWCSGLALDEITDDDMKFWRSVFDTYASINGGKPRTDKQIEKWLKDPHTDSAEYKLWGNGVALPNVVFVLSGIVYYAQFPAFLL